ncbi:uncharacterized protein LOC120944162 [Rana temporaria]|uniref:uncharacterized protein LOC120944162 n=1 Tax=Rana temporaria TaxID=8407 RepID=UPI001AAE1316|nr:uncharacterized protein LOC120944162 [Rana temporaria]
MDLEDMCLNFHIGNMTEDEDTMAVEAHVRALALLGDALRKKEWLLLDREIEYEKSQELNPNCPFLHQQLVLNLVHKLQEVQLLKNGDSAALTHVYPYPDSVSIVLDQSFWEKKEYLDQWSRPGTLILAASQILGYRENISDTYGAGTLTASDIHAAFEIWMNHNGIYKNGIYSCCGEALRDSVCEESSMSHSLLPYMNKSDETDLKKATLKILWDCQKKCLLVEPLEEPQALLTLPKFPIITKSLVEELIEKLQQVKFKCDTRANGIKIAYTDPRTRNIIYVGNLFWKEKDYLGRGSRLGTIILCVAQLLGYPHLFDGATKDVTSETTAEHQGSNSPRSLKENLNKNIHNHNRDSPLPLKNSTPSNTGDPLFNKSETYGEFKNTADTICAAFEIWMSHKGSYENRSYTCCMETARHSVCKNSVMRSCLNELQLCLKDFKEEKVTCRP